VWQINQEEAGIVAKDETDTAEEQVADENEADPNACGASQLATVEPRAIPTVTTSSGAITELKTIDVQVGDGAEVQAGDCVTALYYGTLASTGAKFDGNYETGQPIEFSLDRVIAGWSEGIPGMKVGGVRRLEIPFAQAYGEQGSGGTIPPSSDLIFEVVILNTRQAQ
jgi:FKBP-type peptidyl-prolyl cis-trans isomerase